MSLEDITYIDVGGGNSIIWYYLRIACGEIIKDCIIMSSLQQHMIKVAYMALAEALPDPNA